MQQSCSQGPPSCVCVCVFKSGFSIKALGFKGGSYGVSIRVLGVKGVLYKVLTGAMRFV